MKPARRVGVVGPFPPPVHGAAEVTRHVADALERHVAVERLPISPAAGVAGVSYHASRLFRVLAAARALANGRGPVYLSAAGGFGLGYNVLLATVARLFGRRLLVHHHSFAYLERPDSLASLLVRAAGPSATHICLCRCMADRLAERYRVAKVLLVSNAAFHPPHERAAAAPSGRMRLGHFGNLSREKGLDLVIGVAAALAEAGRDIELVLAGPAATRDASAIIAEGRTRLGRRLIELGPLYGGGKEQFFTGIDVFLFPSRYANEAEPLVVFEALAHGVPVIAVARGCIGGQVGDGGVVIGPRDDFVALASAAIAAWIDSPDSFAAARARAGAQGEVLHREALDQLDRLLTLIAGSCP